MMWKDIYELLPQNERRRGAWVALTVLLRSLLDFAGVAALIPVLVMVMGREPDARRGLLLCGAVLAFVLLKNAVVMRLARFQSRYLLDLYREFSRRMFCNYYRRGLLFLKGKSSVQLGHEVNYVCYVFSLSVLQPLLRMGSDAVLLLMMVVALVVWEPGAGLLLCLGFVPIAMGYVWIVKGRLRRYGAEELEARRRQSRTVVEAFRGYAELEISGAFGDSLRSFDEGLEVINRSRLRMETMQLFPMFLSESSIVVGLALLMSVGGGDLGVVSGVFAIAAYRMIPAVRGILYSWSTLQNASFSIKVVAEGIREEREVPEADEIEEQMVDFGNGLEVKDLHFAFPDGEVLLKGLNFEVKRGERIGVQGPSGSGKSTLFNLLLGFLEPTSGEIRVGGQRLTAGTRRSWHRLVGYVPQEIFIIQGSLAENIALGRAVEPKRIWRVLEQVQLREWAEGLPQGIDSPLGEYGSRLSGGQKQRIGIARALYKEAEVLFFDEATSALDSATEHEINLALEQLSERHKELTMIIIAHRDSSLRFCDRIIKLKG